MNSNRSSSPTVVVVALSVLVLAVSAATAVTTTASGAPQGAAVTTTARDVPEDAGVGSRQGATYTLENLSRDDNRQWHLTGPTETETRQVGRASQRTQLAIYAAIGVAALVAVFGGVYYWRSRQDTYDKLR